MPATAEQREHTLTRALPGISPKGLMEAMDDPSVLTKMSRGDLYVQMGQMRALTKSPAFSMTHRIAYMRLLADMAKVMRQTELEEATAGRRPTITIVLQNGETIEAAAATPDPRTIEGEVITQSASPPSGPTHTGAVPLPPRRTYKPRAQALPHGLLPLPDLDNE